MSNYIIRSGLRRAFGDSVNRWLQCSRQAILSYRTKKIASSILAIAMVFTIGGCTNQAPNPSNEPIQQQTDVHNNEQAIMDNYNTLLQKGDVSIPEIINFIDVNLSAVSQLNGSTMIIGLEKVQYDRLPKMQDKFSDEAVQKIVAKGYQNGVDYVNSIQNKQVKDLLLETKNSGYKIETAEGMFFPVIDYSFYKKYHANMTGDIAAFFDIMAVESDKTPIKDAALIISWAEILKRAQAQEQFIKDYSNSAKVEDMRQQLRRYATFAMYGGNNTPLFSYETKQIVPEAKKVYLETKFDETNGSFSKAMLGYLEVLKKNNYRLTNEVQEYRNKVVEEIR
ncbi:hypothetical protein SDC9_13824 [bioreactor metagenome]|uniref:Uncharacterized protein n=1 Tax=bioreactor metagenome TaxID=1076179 RepID=A0A644TQZ7_9ZZZZ|nr:hypothetical protein [Negativicutes bacterium]